jgi:hypothetical protein
MTFATCKLLALSVINKRKTCDLPVLHSICYIHVYTALAVGSSAFLLSAELLSACGHCWLYLSLIQLKTQDGGEFSQGTAYRYITQCVTIVIQ